MKTLRYEKRDKKRRKARFGMRSDRRSLTSLVIVSGKRSRVKKRME